MGNVSLTTMLIRSASTHFQFVPKILFVDPINVNPSRQQLGLKFSARHGSKSRRLVEVKLIGVKNPAGDLNQSFSLA